MFVYSIFDKKANVFVTPFFAWSDAEAVRSFLRLANDSRSDVNMFPDDFALYRNGKFDINNGNVSGITPVDFICNASSLLSIAQKE